MSAAAAGVATARKGPPTPKRVPTPKERFKKDADLDENSPLLAGKPHTPRGTTFREDLHLALTDPQTPKAKAFFGLVMLAILGSMTSYLLQSMARYEHWHGW